MRTRFTCSFVFAVRRWIRAALRPEYHGGAISFGDYDIALRRHQLRRGDFHETSTHCLSASHL
jgi:hypothetical protein